MDGMRCVKTKYVCVRDSDVITEAADCVKSAHRKEAVFSLYAAAQLLSRFFVYATESNGDGGIVCCC